VLEDSVLADLKGGGPARKAGQFYHRARSLQHVTIDHVDEYVLFPSER
jgi:hypothetical protein